MTKNTQNHLRTLLERAVVKVLDKETFKGTAFFISPRHLLTAYHCVKFSDGNNLSIKNGTYGRLRVLLERGKSFPSEELDIAVLTLAPEVVVKIIDYLPLGLITESQVTDNILAIGYPAEILSFLEGKIHGFPEKRPHQFFNNVMKAEGQSGGPVYHLATQRVVGLALSVYQQEVMKDGGLAGRFDILFREQPELIALNQQAIAHWQPPFNHQLPQFLTKLPVHWRYGLAGLILLIMLILIGIWFSSGDQETEGNCSPIVDKVTGNVSIDCTIGTQK